MFQLESRQKGGETYCLVIASYYYQFLWNLIFNSCRNFLDVMGSFCCNYISYYHWSSLLFGICLADILWICQKAFTEWAPPVCLYQMCCILNFPWISSRYFHKIPLNPHPFPTHKCYWKCHNIFTTSRLALRIITTWQEANNLVTNDYGCPSIELERLTYNQNNQNEEG